MKNKNKRILAFIIAITMVSPIICLNKENLNQNNLTIFAENDNNNTIFIDSMLQKLLDLNILKSTDSSIDGYYSGYFIDLDFDGINEFVHNYCYRGKVPSVYKYIDNEWQLINSYPHQISGEIKLYKNKLIGVYKFLKITDTNNEYTHKNGCYYNLKIVDDICLDKDSSLFPTILERCSWYGGIDFSSRTNEQLRIQQNGEDITEEEFNKAWEEYFANLEEVEYSIREFNEKDVLSLTENEDRLLILKESYNGFSINNYTQEKYQFFDLGKITYEEAEEYCKNLGGHLATITSQEENDYVYNLMVSNGYKSAYFGLTDRDEEGTWKWINNEPVSYLNWHSGEPNNEKSNENYAMFYYKFTDGTWNDGNFGNGTINGGTVFICEYDSNNDNIDIEPIISKHGKIKFSGNFNKDSDSITDYYYSDNYFFEESSNYNPSLATMSLCFEMSSFSSYDKSFWYNPNLTPSDADYWNDKLCNAKTLLIGNYNENDENYHGIGFKNFDANKCWESAPKKDSIGVCGANKKLIDPNTNEEYTLIALAVRGGGYGSEWAGNFTLGESGEHSGFSTAKNQVLSFLNEYIQNYVDSGSKVKLWLVGYSRAGITANMVAGDLINGYELENGVTLDTNKDLFCYTFEAPQGIMKEQIDSSKDYSSIHNFRNLNDLVPYVAPSCWNFTKYGTQFLIPTQITTANFGSYKNNMLLQLNSIGLENTFDIQEEIDKYSYNIKENSQKLKLVMNINKIKSYGEPELYFTEVPGGLPSSVAIENGLTTVFDKFLLSRESFSSNSKMETATINLTEDLMNDFDESKYKKIFDKDTLLYASKPLLFPMVLYPTTYITTTLLTTDVNISEKVTKKVIDLTKDEIRLMIINRLAEKIGVSKEDLENDVDGINTLLFRLADWLYTAYDNNTLEQELSSVWYCIDAFACNNGTNGKISSEYAGQAHYSEITLAWARSFDSNYGVLTSTENCDALTREVFIYCKADIEVFDSNGNSVGKIINDKVQDSNSIIGYCDNYDCKVLYLPGDMNYKLEITPHEDGKLKYSIYDYDFSTRTSKGTNFDTINVKKGKKCFGVITNISEINGIKSFVTVKDGINTTTSSYGYTLIDENNNVIEPSEVLTEEEIKEFYYTVSLTSEGNGGIVTNGGGTFLKGTYTTVEAQVLPFSEFLGWYINDELVSTDLAYTFEVTDNMNFVAKFKDVEYYTLSNNETTGGKITSVEGSYSQGVEIEIVAEANEGYEFDRWESSDSTIFANVTSANTTITMPAEDVTLIAHFKLAKITDIIYGDINKDGKISVIDALLAVKGYTGETTLTDEQTEIADVNDDGKLSVVDAMLIIKGYTGEVNPSDWSVNKK